MPINRSSATVSEMREQQKHRWDNKKVGKGVRQHQFPVEIKTKQAGRGLGSNFDEVATDGVTTREKGFDFSIAMVEGVRTDGKRPESLSQSGKILGPSTSKKAEEYPIPSVENARFQDAVTIIKEASKDIGQSKGSQLVPTNKCHSKSSMDVVKELDILLHQKMRILKEITSNHGINIPLDTVQIIEDDEIAFDTTISSISTTSSYAESTFHCAQRVNNSASELEFNERGEIVVDERSKADTSTFLMHWLQEAYEATPKRACYPMEVHSDNSSEEEEDQFTDVDSELKELLVDEISDDEEEQVQQVLQLCEARTPKEVWDATASPLEQEEKGEQIIGATNVATMDLSSEEETLIMFEDEGLPTFEDKKEEYPQLNKMFTIA
eukprot:Gb_15392 [translate_table: standard]